MEPARVGEIPAMRLDISRAAAELGWRPRTELSHGLSATITWYHARVVRPAAAVSR
jgi:UDP-glucose 4-epimerase